MSSSYLNISEKRSSQNYLPLAITTAVKEYVTIELGLSARVQELKCKKVTNIKYTVKFNITEPSVPVKISGISRLPICQKILNILDFI
jgi:hypothetical protein